RPAVASGRSWRSKNRVCRGRTAIFLTLLWFFVLRAEQPHEAAPLSGRLAAFAALADIDDTRLAAIVGGRCGSPRFAFGRAGSPFSSRFARREHVGSCFGAPPRPLLAFGAGRPAGVSHAVVHPTRLRESVNLETAREIRLFLGLNKHLGH